ncbi:DnaJ-class molecular chaperone CbpA [hydrothermal vent metagenome]|uniref:DnaJ-class molecular chaperone CbpA n=1 Tax=hydrothermal vent metagenome TaxID=652676 RepID=A0A3B0SYD5_9ZZZZ
MTDPYKILGVAKTADEAVIRKAYRNIAKKYHPDVRPNDAAAEDKFKQASAAFALLNNKEERAKYDRGEIDAQGNAKGPFAGAGAQPGGFQGGFAPGGFEDISDVLSELFGRRTGMGGRQHFSQRGEDQNFLLDIDMVEAILGGSRQVRLADGKTLKIKVPAGVQSGRSLRLKGQGGAGMGGGPPGDAIVELRVKPHRFYQLDGNRVRLDLPITLDEAVLGAKVKVPTPDGAVSLRIPANTSSGQIFRVKGKGGSTTKGVRGDLLVRVMIVLPDAVDKKLVAFLEQEKKSPSDEVRRRFFS